MKPVFLSEGGIGSVMHVIRELRCWEQAGANLEAEDAVLMRSMADSFVADWKRLGMDGVYAFPEDMLTDSQRLHCRQRRMFFDLVRSNPQICGYNLTGMLDHGIYLAPSAFEAGFVSIAHSDEDLEETLAAAKKVFDTL